MKIAFVAVAALTLASPAFAQDAHAGHDMSAHAGHDMAAMKADAKAAARLNLDTPVEVIVADPAGKAALDAALGMDIAAREHYNAFKGMGLKQLANYAPDKLTAEVLAKTEAALAAIK